MSLVLGIDTGGTYTDGVVFDRVAREVLAKAKSRTTREDLSIGITRVIEAVEFDELDKIEVVSMSTTLATNAIVEGAGCEVGLIMLGGNMIICLIIINILKMKNMVDFHLQIIAQFQWHFLLKVQMLIILDIAL